MSINSTMSPSSGYRYSPYIVSKHKGLGTHTDLQSAIDAAIAGPQGLDGTFPVIFIREEEFALPAFYTIAPSFGNFTLTITCFPSGNGMGEYPSNYDISAGAFKISGVDATIHFSGLYFDSTTQDFIQIVGDNPQVIISNCHFHANTLTPKFVNDNGNTCSILMNTCSGNLLGGSSVFDLSGVGTSLKMIDCSWKTTNAFYNSLPWSFANSVVTMINTESNGYFDATGTTSVTMFDCRILSNGNAIPVIPRTQFVLSDTATLTATGCKFDADFPVIGSTQQVGIVNAGATATLINCTLNSNSASGAISGAGTLNYGGIIFTGTGNFTNVTTETYFPLTVKQGGTGASTLTTDGVLIGNATAAVTATAAGTTGQFLGGNTGSAPTFQSLPASSISITGDSGGALTGSSFTLTGGTTGLTFAGAGTTETLGGELVVANGGTGRATLTDHGVLVGAGTSAITQLAAGSAGQVLQSGGASADPTYSTATYPSVATGTGKILRADGTNWVATTATYPDTAGTSGNVLTSDGTNFVSSPPPTGTVVQQVRSSSAATTSTTATIPNDDTIPQNTEGTELYTLAITPKSASNTLFIEVFITWSNSLISTTAFALFQDSTANALYATSELQAVADNLNQTSFRYYMTAGTTSSTTFKVRYGNNGGGGVTTRINSISSGRLYGGVLLSTFTITEVLT